MNVDGGRGLAGFVAVNVDGTCLKVVFGAWEHRRSDVDEVEG